MRFKISGFLSAAVLGMVILGTAGADEIPTSKVPAKVLSAVKSKYPNAELITAFKDLDDYEVFISVVLKYKDHEYEVTVDTAGTIVQIAKDVDPKLLPAPVLQGLQKKYPGAKINVAAEVTEPELGSKTYHVEISTAAKTVVELVIGSKGTILQKNEVKEVNEAKVKK
jgi:Putative beta-lactamase-inhibitor-like, PepSY-like